MVPAQNFVSISRRPPDVEDYIDMLRRYRSWIIGPMFAGLVIATVVAFFWPDTYISTAVMRITPQQVPDRLVPSVITSQMADRLQQMQTDILSRTSLAEIIQKPSLDLYKKDRAKLPMEDIVQDMRNKYIRITPLTDSQSPGGSRRLASAFAISFMYTDRYKAQAVVRELVTKFTEQNVTVQRNQANLTTNFLTDELKGSKEKMVSLEDQLTKFKMANQGRLPEQAQANAQALQTYELQLMNTQGSLNRAMQDKILLETNLTNIRTAINNAQANLEETVGGSGPAGGQFVESQRLIDLNRFITDAESKLAALKENLGKNHPDVSASEAALQSYKSQRDSMQRQETARQAAFNATAATAASAPARVVQNPVIARQLEEYRAQQNQVQTQVATKQMEIDTLKQNQARLEQVIGEFNRRLQDAPLNEQQYNSLIRDFNLAKQEYEDMTKRHEAAETAQNIEEHKAGENLEVLDPASLPEQPAEPNRLQWAAIGTFAGLGLGIMLAAAQEVKNTSLKNLKDVRAYTNMPVLSSIPLLENALLVRRKRRLVWLAWASAIILGCILMSGSMYYHLSGI
jgi:polysaccharide chain length determinant protein (PEP-CTERM system associated)